MNPSPSAMPSSAAHSITPSRTLSAAVIEEATQWLLRVTDDAAVAADHDACRRWRAEHADHELAWQRMQSLWQGFEAARPVAARKAVEAGVAVGLQRRALRHRTLAVVGALLVPLAALWLLRPDISTAAGEVRVVQLDDNSRLTLDGASKVDVAFSGGERRIRLRQGQLQIEVARDAQRPFVIETTHGTAQALGTRYTVQQMADATVVAVQESRVRACNLQQQCVDLQAGDSVRLDQAAPGAIVHRDADTATAWTRGQLVVDDQSLADVLRQLTLQYRGDLRFDDTELAGLRVSGVFPLHDVERALDVLARTQPILLRSSWWGGVYVSRFDDSDATANDAATKTLAE